MSVKFQPYNKSIDQILDALITLGGNIIEKIVVVDDPNIDQDKPHYSQRDELKKYGNLIYFPTKEELNFNNYLNLESEYSVGERIIWFKPNKRIYLCECTRVEDKKVTWEKLDEREYEFTEKTDFKHLTRILRLTMDQVHIVFEKNQKEINSIYGSKLYNYGFKSVNFIKRMLFPEDRGIVIARDLISDQSVSLFVNFEDFDRDSDIRNFAIQDWGFIHIPKLIKEYELRTDIMGIDLGATRCVVAVSRNKNIQVIPLTLFHPEISEQNL